MRAGDKILNYTVTRRIKAGGMGVVFEGEQNWGSRRKVAIKQLLENLRDDDIVRRRFTREAEILEMLDNQHIVRILGFDHEQDAFVMEFVEGRTVADVLRENPDTFRKPDILFQFFISLLDAFDYAHNVVITLNGRTEQGIVHRDIKPSNIIVQPDGNPKILDFGISRVASFQSTLTDPKLQMGSVPYMSPEQIATPIDVDWRSDIYSLGVTLWELLVGRSPYPRVTTHEVVVEVQRQIRFEPLPSLLQTVINVNPEEEFFLRRLDQVIERATAKDRVFRYQHCEEMKAALQKAFEDWQNQSSETEETQVIAAAPQIKQAEWNSVTFNKTDDTISSSLNENVPITHTRSNRSSNHSWKVFIALAPLMVIGGYLWWQQQKPSTSDNLNEQIRDTFPAKKPTLTLADSCYEAGNSFYNNKNFKQATYWYKRAAELGNTDSQSMLGLMYQYGQGVTKDINAAVKWFQASAKQGNADGQKNLGYMYLEGLGVEKDYTKALKWYKASAEQGNAEGQANLGIMYEQAIGVEANNFEALKWYMRAANQQLPRAQYYVGTMYATGKGVKQSESKAIQWYQLAARLGEINAQQELRRLGRSW
ncbi:hypothetical protein DYU11_09140 [Fibrisoma montanum]|uniref:Protein kinase domain-containing protein n=1 Tax=Fibrisoma montanum TaxID=2305895 RepID=A0A418MF72_9BACT|nr:serine/threonine-protein kinase [Fibrisoma montanum]RIV25452.1 hypothetical protein DYU11_09140 [Fibrisoma montanum]